MNRRDSTHAHVHAHDKETYAFNILVIGELGVGKTSLKLRYTDNVFDPDIKANAGIDFKVKIIPLYSEEYVKLSIWDTAGSEKYRSIANNYFKNAHGILLCFDISNRQSFEELNKFWLNFIDDYLETGNNRNRVCFAYLVGNKMDLEHERKVTYKEGEELAKSFNSKYYETSSLNGYGVETVFNDMVVDLVDKTKELNENDNADVKGLKLSRDASFYRECSSEISKDFVDSRSAVCC
jgi:small GTP-binding protein